MKEEFNFLKKKYSLQNKPEVIKAKERTERKTGEKISQKPEDKIENYLNRFEEIFNREDDEEKERGIQALTKILFKNNIIKAENIPDRVYQLEQEIAFNQGHGYIEITEEYKKEKQKEIVNKQKESLSQWIDYLSSNDALYPMWAKYWVLNSVLKLGVFNKEKGYFDKRSKKSASPFPTVNPMAIAKSIETIQSKINKEEIKNFSNKSDEEFQKILDKEDFGKIYAEALLSMPEFSEKGLENINGEWVVYEQGSDAKELYDSLQGYPLEWCTAGSIDTAQGQLEGGDFYVYYSEDSNGKNKIPRVAIRMEDDKIAEVRGIEKGQELDNFIGPVVKEKMEEFGSEGEKYEKKLEDMERLTEIYDKTFKIIDFDKGEKKYLNPEYTNEEIKFIYEIDSKIEGFGYQRDLRIDEIVKERDGKDFEKIRDYFREYISKISFKESLEFIKKICENRIDEGYCHNPYEEYISDLIKITIDNFNDNKYDDYEGVEENLNKGNKFVRGKYSNGNKNINYEFEIYKYLSNNNVSLDFVSFDKYHEEVAPVKLEEFYIKNKGNDLIEYYFKNNIQRVFSEDFILAVDKENSGLLWKLEGKIDKFSPKNQQLIFDLLVETSSRSIYDNLSKYKKNKNIEIDYKIFMQNLSNLSEKDITDDFWNSIKGNENSAAMYLLTNCYDGKFVLMENLDKFKNKMSLEVVNEINKKWKYRGVIENLDKFENLDINDIIESYLRYSEKLDYW